MSPERIQNVDSSYLPNSKEFFFYIDLQGYRSFRWGSYRLSEGSPRPPANFFFIIFNLTFIFHLSDQEAFFVKSLTQDPSLIWNNKNPITILG